MSAALALPRPTPPPGPDRPWGNMTPVVRFAIFLRKIINCGKELCIAVRLRAHRPDFPRFAKPFGIPYLPHILRRIDAAIRRAVLMEEIAMKQAGIIPPPAIRNRAP